MKTDLLKLRSRFEKLSRREKIFVLLAFLGVICLGWESLLLKPAQARHKALENRIAQVRGTIAEFELQRDAILARGDSDPNAENRQILARLKNEDARMERRLSELATELIAPREVSRVLRGLLRDGAGPELLHLENLPAEELAGQGEPEAQGQEVPRIYRHPLQMEFAGTFQEALIYLKAVENLKDPIFWDELELEVQEYPRCRIRLRVFTLSLERRWIGV